METTEGNGRLPDSIPATAESMQKNRTDVVGGVVEGYLPQVESDAELHTIAVDLSLGDQIGFETLNGSSVGETRTPSTPSGSCSTRTTIWRTRWPARDSG